MHLLRNTTSHKSGYEYIKIHSVEKEKQEELAFNLLWWKILGQAHEKNYVREYIRENRQNKDLTPLKIHWLKEWEKVIPKFYYVGHKYSERIFIVIDLLTEKTIEVILLDPKVQPIHQGSIVMGTLIPFGDGLYFPILNFYHFDYPARKEIAAYLHRNYRKGLQDTSPFEDFFLLLSEVLQIEKFITENSKEEVR